MRRFAVTLGLLALLACGNQEPQDAQPRFSAEQPTDVREYVFAIHPLHNPVHLFEVFGPLIDYLNRQIPEAKFRLEASRNYEAFEQKLQNRQVEFALPNPYQTLKAMQYGYHVIAKMGEDRQFTGIVLTRRDSGIDQVTDLKGKRVAYPARTALAATMMPQYYFQTHGLNVLKDVESLYVGSQESAIMNVYLGDVAAGATWPLPWEAFQQQHPERAAELTVKWETEPLINNSVMARDDMPGPLAARLAEVLDRLHTSEEGRRILKAIPLSRFELADDARYHVVTEFLERFSQTVRRPEE
jgi:phosphonate transport system substrate-binding protein